MSAGDHAAGYVPLGAVADIQQINTPTEVDHNQIRRVIDIYVATKTEALQGVGAQIDKLLAETRHDKNTVLDVRGAVVSMNQAFHDFGVGLIIAILLVYLILMAQFASFIDPFIILMAIPPGLAGVALILLVTGSSLNIMSLMGVIMMAGIVVSNSILIVEFAGILHQQGMALKAAVVESCKVRLRPILMTSLATLLGMIPMALGLEAGSEQYAPLARAIIGGLALSVVVTMFLVPAVYLVIHGRRRSQDRGRGEIDMKEFRRDKLIRCRMCASCWRLVARRAYACAAGAAPESARPPSPLRQPARAIGNRLARRPTGPKLSLADAERMAIQHNPNISVARLIALAQAQVTREVRSRRIAHRNRQPDRCGRARKQPHHRRLAQQPLHLRSRRRRLDGEPTHHRLRTHA